MFLHSDQLKGQIAMVTGASGGVGQAIVSALAQQRTHLVLTGRRDEELHTLAAKLMQSALSLRIYPADLAREDEVQKLSNQVLKDFGGVDILVHCLGVSSIGPVETSQVKDFDLQYAVNVRAPYLLTQAFLPSLKRKKGQIVFVNSTVGLQSRANVAQYAATKHALRAIADSLREELNVAGVRVLTVYLGRTATPMQAETYRIEGREYHSELLLQPEDVATMVIGAISLPRTAEVVEIRMRPMIHSY